MLFPAGVLASCSGVLLHRSVYNNLVYRAQDRRVTRQTVYPVHTKQYRRKCLLTRYDGDSPKADLGGRAGEWAATSFA